MTDKRDALWLPIVPKIFDEMETTLSILKLKAKGFNRIILKIHMTQGPVDWRCWNNLTKSQQKILIKFIKWHVKNRPVNTVEIYGGMVLPINYRAWWAEISPYICAGALRKFWLDTGSKEEHMLRTLELSEVVSPHQFIIGTEALGLDENGDALPELNGLPRLCTWQYYKKHVKMPISYNGEVICVMRPSKKFGEPTINDVQMLRNENFTIAYSRNMATKLRIASDPLGDEENDLDNGIFL